MKTNIESLPVPPNPINGDQTRSRDHHVLQRHQNLHMQQKLFSQDSRQRKTFAVKFLMGEAGFAPIERMTIPDAKLQATVYEEEMDHFIVEESDY